MKLILFDIDGTLLNASGLSKPLFCRALTEVFGVEIGWNLPSLGDRTDWQIALDLLASHGLEIPPEDPRLQQAFARIAVLWERLPTGAQREDVVVYPGVEALFCHLAGEDRVCGLLTANLSGSAWGKLQVAGLPTTHLRFGAFGDDARRKSELPALALRRAVKVSGRFLAGSEVIVVGDTPTDIACARAIGGTAVAVATGYTSYSELAAHAPDYLFRTFADVDALLEVLKH